MTIKEFAALCACTAQTLRYYDRIDLLKPVKVDPWSGYRWYEPAQAVDFVKIKNLQAADFTISEIKSLLTQSDREVCRAFEAKIAEQKQKLERIREIQQSYLAEKNTMETMIHNLTDSLLVRLSDPGYQREFGLRAEDAPKIARLLRTHLEDRILSQSAPAHEVTLVLEGETDGASAFAFTLDPENPPDTITLGKEHVVVDPYGPGRYEPLWEAHGWAHPFEFIPAVPTLEPGSTYAFSFRLKELPEEADLLYPLYMLGTMLLRGHNPEAYGGGFAEASGDGDNHFTLLRRT